MDQLVEAGILTADIAHAVFTSHDLDSNGFIDKTEFVHMMCPEMYRVGSTAESSATTEVLSAWVSHRRQSNGVIVRKGETGAYHLVHEWTETLDHSAMPTAFKDFPLAAVYRKWECAFDSLAAKKNLDGNDGNDEDFVDLGDLRRSGIVHQEVATALVERIDAHLRSGFTRKGFLEAMCQAHGFRVPDGLQQLEDAD